MFTSVIAPLDRWLRLEGVKVILYLDWLVLVRSLRDRDILMDLTSHLGIILYLEKCCLDPAQTRAFLGFLIDLVTFSATLMEK